MAIERQRFTDEQIAQLVPTLEPQHEAQIALLIASAEGGDQAALRDLLWTIEAYVKHPDQLVRFMARRLVAP